MKNSRRLLSAVTALIVALCAAGCGSDSSKDNAAKATGGRGASGYGTKAAEEGEIAAEAETADLYSIDGDYGDFDGEFSEEFAAADIAFDDAAKSSDGALPDWAASEDTAPQSNSVQAAAKMLTAGEWNDNDNWGFFTNLVNSGTISFPSYGIDPCNRIEVDLTESGGNPAVNVKVTLIGADGKALWSAVTDKNGKAYLFAPDGETPASVIVNTKTGEISAEITATAKNNEQGNSSVEYNTVEITVNDSSELYKNTEIMFIVDSTGSMADEMLFLQSEFSAIAEEIGTDNTTYSVNFYRDEGDEYVTKCSPFTNDISKLQSTLNSERADGGGDFPEAVAQILDETITKGKWSEESVKLAFLIFDAPPHEGTEETLKTAVKAASEKGVRLIPVVSSNADRDTELFGRAISICTGGTYVFLTDDSGIGDSHLEPIIGEYKVEKLYDIIVRIINDYKQ